MNSEKMDSQEILSFKLAESDYGLDVMSVREIKGWTKATPIPNTKNYVLGVINLRGTVLPVIDLSVRLGMSSISAGERSAVVVVEGQNYLTGMLVDSVSDIISIKEDEAYPRDFLKNGEEGLGVKSLSLVDDRIVRVLDVESIVEL